MKIENVLYLPSGRVFLIRTDDNYLIESTEMRDVTIDGKLHSEVRETLDPHIIWKHLVPYEKKWLLTVSTQRGCAHDCKFCDVANLPFKGNLTQLEIEEQIGLILECSPYVQKCDKVKIGFARMGEPSWNVDNVLGAMENLYKISKDRKFIWLPCFNTILPRRANCIKEVLAIKEEMFRGFLHFQISCNSTDENKRRELFGGADVLSLEEIIGAINKEYISTRTVTLNFIVMEGVEVSVEKLKNFGLNSDKFSVKLIPLNNTLNAQSNDLQTYANYSNYDKLLQLKQQFEDAGVLL
jgi:23S rRNA (adenine2503-C2)-methyltransferase